MAAGRRQKRQSGDERLIPILFLGPSGDRRIPRAVEKLLFRGEALLCRSGQTAVFSREGRTYGLFESEGWGQSLVVIKEGARGAPLPPNALAGGFVVRQEDAPWLHQTGEVRGQVVSCGMSLRDTLTYSSCQDGQPVVSLLRPIHGPFGRLADPPGPASAAGDQRRVHSVGGSGRLPLPRAPAVVKHPLKCRKR